MFGFPDAPPDAGPDQGLEAQGLDGALSPGPILILKVRDVAPSPAILLAVSTEPLLIHISAQDVEGAYYSPTELASVGFEMCFVDGMTAPAFDQAWYRLTFINGIIGGVYAAAWLLFGPEGGENAPGLTSGVYQRFVRTASGPHMVRKITPLTVEGPNP